MDIDWLKEIMDELDKQFNQKARIELTMKIKICDMPLLFAQQQEIHDELIGTLNQACEKMKESFKEINLRVEHNVDTEVFIEEGENDENEST